MIVRFPGEVLEELDVLCDKNIMGRAEFIQISLRQMVEYIDRYAPHLTQLQMQEEAKQSRQIRAQEARKAAAARAAAISPVPDSPASVPCMPVLGKPMVAARGKSPSPSRRRRGYRNA